MVVGENVPLATEAKLVFTVKRLVVIEDESWGDVGVLHGDLVSVLDANDLVYPIAESDQLLTSLVELILRKGKFDYSLKMKLPSIFLSKCIDYFLLLW